MKRNRRAFLLGGGVAAVAAATLAVKSPTRVASTNTKPASTGYQLTAHIRNYYRTTSI